MSNQQLYLVIGVSALMYIAGFTVQSKQIESIQKQMDVRFEVVQSSWTRFGSI